jgi:hypothetical protein
MVRCWTPEARSVGNWQRPWHVSILVRFLVPLVLFVAACSPAGSAVGTGGTTTDIDPIALSLSLYIVDEAGRGSESPMSSQRDVASVERVAGLMQGIWDQAGIELDISTITRVEASSAALSDLARGDTAAFLDDIYFGVTDVPDPGAVNGFYVGSLGTINGVAPFGSRVFFVTDEPSVLDERVSSHEIGHILGLHHAADDAGRLMFSGTNGMELVDEEIGTSRYAAQGIINGVR